MMPWITAVACMIGLLLIPVVVHLLRLHHLEETPEVLSHSSCCGSACAGTDQCTKNNLKETHHENQ